MHLENQTSFQTRVFELTLIHISKLSSLILLVKYTFSVSLMHMHMQKHTLCV